MKRTTKVRRLTRSIMGLFVTKKSNSTFLSHKDEYYKHYWFNKKLCDGIKIVADIERSSKKQAAELLMKAGLSSYMGGKLTDYIHSEQIAREQNQKNKNDPLRYGFEKICQRTWHGYFKNYLMTWREASFSLGVR